MTYTPPLSHNHHLPSPLSHHPNLPLSSLPPPLDYPLLYPTITTFPPTLSHYHYLPTPFPFLSLCPAFQCFFVLSPVVLCCAFFIFRYALPCCAMFRYAYVLSSVAGVYVLARMLCRVVLACMCFFTSDRLVSVDKSTTLEVLAIDIIAMVMDATIASNLLEWCIKFAQNNMQQEAVTFSEQSEPALRRTRVRSIAYFKKYVFSDRSGKIRI
jgi:hypothetical protein